jgi:hypothetical protein
MSTHWYVWLNSNIYFSAKPEYKNIGKNAIYMGDPNCILQTENISVIGHCKIYNEPELWKMISIDTSQKEYHPLRIILELYQNFGFEDMLEVIEGDFAFALLDYNISGEESRFYVARDPFGLYPLYEWSSVRPGKVQFATDNIQYGFSSNGYGDQEFPFEAFPGGYYHNFIHSFKVSSVWKPLSSPTIFYKLPFCSTYYKGKIEYDYNIHLDIAMKKRLRWILFSRSKMSLTNNNNIKVGIISLESTNVDLKCYLENLTPDYINIDLKYDLENLNPDNNILEFHNINDINIFGNNPEEIILEAEYPNIITRLKQTLKSSDPSVIRSYLIPIITAKYLAENHPDIKHVFLNDSFTYEWIETNYFDRRKKINQLYLSEKIKGWTQVFVEYGIELYMPFLDRILVQTINYGNDIYLRNESSPTEEALVLSSDL